MSHGFTCSLCGQTMTSKCPQTRSVFFTEDEGMGVPYLSSAVASLTVEPFNEGSGYDCLRWEFGCLNRNLTPEQLATEFCDAVKIVAAMPKEQIVRALCSHHWTLPEGEVCMEGHEHAA